MPFLPNENNDFDDGTPAFNTEQARRESAKNIVTTLQNDLVQQMKMYIQEVDPETGFPTRKTLVSGGLEYFNDHEISQPNVTGPNIDAILAGDVPLDEMMTTLTGTPKHVSPQPHPITTPTAPATPQHHDDVLRLLGFDFLRTVPTLPDKHVQLAFTGLATFQVPLACHAIVVTGSLVILVTDKRSVPAGNEMDVNVDPSSVQTTLIFPDKTVIPITAPVPRTISFEIGILRCTLFVRR